MNKHILLVMKYLNDKDSVSQEELEKNAAAAAAYAATVDDAAADTAAYVAYVAASAKYAAYATYDAARWIEYYFKQTGEDKQTYLDYLENNHE